MTFRTQSQPIVQISKVLLGFVRPMHTMSSPILATMFAGAGVFSPPCNPTMERTIADVISFPVCRSSKLIKRREMNKSTFSRTEFLWQRWNSFKLYLANTTTSLKSSTFRFATAETRTIYPSVWSRQEWFSTLFTGFSYHITDYSI